MIRPGNAVLGDLLRDLAASCGNNPSRLEYATEGFRLARCSVCQCRREVCCFATSVVDRTSFGIKF